jgi:arylsulfatase A-like enzyme
MADHFKVQVQRHNAAGRYPATNTTTAEGHSTDVFAASAGDFIARQDSSKPFFVHVAFTAPHDPRQALEEYQRLYPADRVSLPANFLAEHPFNNGEMLVRDEQLLPWPRTPDAVRAEIARYYAMITHLDARIGGLMAQLKEKGLLENTIVVFAADNGLALGSHGLMGKQNLYGHSVGVPLIVAGPGIEPGQRSDALVYLHDLNPTLLELAGVKPVGMDARSFAGVLAGTATRHRDELFFAYGNVQRGITDGRFKLIRYAHLNRTQLFDLAADPLEQRDLSALPEGLAAMTHLTARLQQVQAELGDKLPLTTSTPAPMKIPLVPAARKAGAKE